MRRDISHIAIPAIVTNITTPLLSLADMAITGHIGEAAYIAAIALGGTLFNTLYWLFGFLRMGTTGLAAQAYGARGDYGLVFWRSLAIALGIGAVLVLLGRPLCGVVLDFMDADDSAQILAQRYVRILVWGAPAVLGTYAAMGWLIGMQNTRATMVTAIATNVINIGASCILVFGCGLTIEGVATGTLIAQWSGFLIVLALIYRKYRPARPATLRRLGGGQMMRFFRINVDIFLRTVCLVAVTLWFTHAGALEGVDVLAANALLLQLFMLFSYFMDGFAYAAEALAGKYYGAADEASLRQLIRTLNRIGITFAVVFAALYFLGGEVIIRLLTDRPEVVAVARDYMLWAVAVPLCGYLAFIYDGLFVGLTRTRGMLVAMAAALVVFFALWLSLRSSWHNNALWLAFNAYLLTRGIVQVLLYHRRE